MLSGIGNRVVPEKNQSLFLLVREALCQSPKASNNDRAFSPRMQAERNFDCGRELSLEENAVDLSTQQAIAKFCFVDPAKDDRRPGKNDRSIVQQELKRGR